MKYLTYAVSLPIALVLYVLLLTAIGVAVLLGSVVAFFIELFNEK